MRKITFFLLLASFLLSGCWDQREINNLAIVTATAIDITDDNHVELAVEIYVPKSSSGGQESGGGVSGGTNMTMVTAATGENIGDALSEIQGKTPRKIFFGACKVYIFGEKAAEKGIREHMDFLLRHPQPRERSYFYVSEGKAKTMIELKTVLERYTGETMREIVEMGNGYRATMLEVDQMLMTEEHGLAMPYVKKAKEEVSEGEVEELAEISGVALFPNDQMTGIMSAKSSWGLLWLRNELEDFILPVSLADSKVTINTGLREMKIKTSVKNGKPRATLAIRTEGQVVQNETGKNLSASGNLRKLDKSFTREVEKRIQTGLKEAQKMQTDVFRIGKAFHHQHPEKWAEVRHRWPEAFSEMEIDVVVDAKVRREGYLNEPIKNHKGW